jgi:hypothetical protein
MNLILHPLKLGRKQNDLNLCSAVFPFVRGQIVRIKQGTIETGFYNRNKRFDLSNKIGKIKEFTYFSGCGTLFETRKKHTFAHVSVDGSLFAIELDKLELI